MPDFAPTPPESLGPEPPNTGSLRDELREKVVQLQLLAEQLPIILWTTDMELRCTSVWGAGLRGLNLRPGELVGITVMDFLNTTDLRVPGVAAHVDATKGRPSGFEIVLSQRILQCHVVPQKNPSGEVVGAVGVAMDVTEIRRAERDLRESRDMHRMIAESVHDAIISIDEESRIVFVNRAVESLFGYRKEELIGRPITILMSQELAGRHLKGIKTYVASGLKTMPWSGVELPAQHKSGRSIQVEISFCEIQHEGHRTFTGVVRDVSGRKRNADADSAKPESHGR